MGFPDIKIVIAGVDKFSSKMGKVTKGLDKIGKKAGRVGRKMTLMATLPILAFGTLAVKTTADYEFAMNKVAAKTNATGKEFKSLEDMALKLGETTRFSAVESAQGMDFLAMAGFKTNEILEALPGTLNLAAASSISLAEAADISTNILTAFGLKTKNISYLNDVMAQAMASANFNMLEIGESMTYAAGTSKSMGVKVMETTKLLGLLANAGVKGSRAGVSLANVMSKLAAPSSKAIEILKAKGFKKSDIFTVDGKFKNLTQTLLKLNKAGVNIPEMKEIFGERAVKTFAGIFGADMQKNVDAMNEKMKGFGGSAKRMEDVMMRGLPGALARLKSAFEGMLLKITGKSGIGDAVGVLIDKLTKLVSWVGNLSPKTLKLVAVFAGLLAALGPVLVVIGGFLAAIAGIPTVLAGIPLFLGGLAAIISGIGAAFAFIISPIGIAILAIVAVGYVMVRHWKLITSYWIDLFQPVIKFFKHLFGFFKYVWQKIPTGFKKMALNIVSVLFPVIGIFRLMWKLVKPLLGIASKFGSKLAPILKYVFLGKDVKNKVGLTTGEESFSGGTAVSPAQNSNFKGVLRIENLPPGSNMTVEDGDMEVETDTGFFPVGAVTG